MKIEPEEKKKEKIGNSGKDKQEKKMFYSKNRKNRNCATPANVTLFES